MKLLVIDTSGPVCGTAVMDGEKVLCEYTAQNRNTHSASLMPMVERSLESAGVTLKELDALAAVTGPGSFTGVRIGVATVKALAHGSGKPCIGVNALEALAGARREDAGPGLVCPIQDARAGQVYGAAFRGRERVLPDGPMKLEEYLGRRSGGGARTLSVYRGRGAGSPGKIDPGILGDRRCFAEGPFAYLRPSVAGLIAQETGEITDYRTLRESYLRPPNAEKNKKLLEAMRHE